MTIINSITKVIIIFIIAFPISIGLTIFILPFWRWFEVTTNIESVGHSGPAMWCYIIIYILSGTSASLWFQKK